MSRSKRLASVANATLMVVPALSTHHSNAGRPFTPAIRSSSSGTPNLVRRLEPLVRIRPYPNPTAGYVKLVRPPRQSRGISLRISASSEQERRPGTQGIRAASGEPVPDCEDEAARVSAVRERQVQDGAQPADIALVRKLLRHLGVRDGPLPRAPARDPAGQTELDFDAA